MNIPPRHLRAHLDQSKHATIDSALKGLKKSSRSLQVALTAWSTESQILDRIYYKGKNQHRGALFWRRVAELRRLCGRLRRINPYQKLNMFRASFFGGDVLQNGPWSRFPDVKATQIFLDDTGACFELVKKMHEQCMRAYESFTISLRGGAFLQLLLVLSALSARLSSLASELFNILSKLLELTRQVLTAVTGGQVFHNGSLPEAIVSDDEIVDISPLEEPVKSPSLQSLVGGPNVATTSGDQALVADDIPESAPKSPPAAPNRPLRSSASTIKKKMKMRKRDEIDEIFGL